MYIVVGCRESHQRNYEMIHQSILGVTVHISAVHINHEVLQYIGV